MEITAIRDKRQLQLLLGAAHSLNHSLFLILPQVLLLVIEEFHISKFAIGTIAMVASFIYGCGSLAGGILSDKIREEKIVSISLLFSGLSTLIFLFADNLFIFGFGMALIGLWGSLYHPTANALISKFFQEKMGISMGIHGVGGSLGVILTPIIAALLGASYGWRFAFLLFGGFCVIVSMFFRRFFVRMPTENRNKFGFHFIDSDIEGFKLKSLWLILLLNVTIGLYMKGIELFFQTYLISYPFINLEIESASFIAAIATTFLLTTGIAGQILGGRVSDILGSKKVLQGTALGVVAGLIFLQLFPIPTIGVALFILLYGFSFYAHQPAFNSLIGKLTPMNRRGTVFGVFFFMSFGIGSLSQSLIGYLADLFGLKFSFYVLTCFAISALLLSFSIPSQKKNIQNTLATVDL